MLIGENFELLEEFNHAKYSVMSNVDKTIRFKNSSELLSLYIEKLPNQIMDSAKYSSKVYWKGNKLCLPSSIIENMLDRVVKGCTLSHLRKLQVR